MPNFKDITNRFLDIEEWNCLNDALCVMSSLSIVGSRTKIGKNVTYNLGDGLTSIHYGVISSFMTTNGDCSRVLEVLTGRLSGRIVGIHVAGSVGPQKKISLAGFIDRDTVVSITRELIGEGNCS